MSEKLRVAIVQTTLNKDLAWLTGAKSFPEMNEWEADRVWDEVWDGLKSISLLPENKRPHIILLPEFGVARKYEWNLHSFSRLTGSIVISGLDFIKEGTTVKNEALVSIPYNWPFGKGTSESQSFRFGKRHPAWREKEYIQNHKTEDGRQYEFFPSETVYILDLGQFGRVGLAICADFYDIERYLIYQGQIQHLFLVAYNQDTESFHHLAESASRLIFCNVVICNTGFHGGSMAFSPRKQVFERTIYSHLGSRLYTLQTVELPVDSLVEAQDKGHHKDYKSSPPGYTYWKNKTKSNAHEI